MGHDQSALHLVRPGKIMPSISKPRFTAGLLFALKNASIFGTFYEQASSSVVVTNILRRE
jgi:hypothetical protein